MFIIFKILIFKKIKKNYGVTVAVITVVLAEMVSFGEVIPVALGPWGCGAVGLWGCGAVGQV